jgi:AcrR family transcriptional regulator
MPRSQSSQPDAAKRVRLAAPERRAAVLDVASRVFAEGSYRGTTTAEIARAAGVTEPILYRHFPSKRALYLACVDETWRRLRELWDAAVAGEPDPALWVRSMAQTYRDAGGLRDTTSSLLLQAIAEANEDAETRAYVRRHLRRVHRYVADVHRRAQAAGGIAPGRDPDAEAWVFLALGLLRVVDDTVPGLVGDAFPAIADARLAWLTGR